VPWVRDRFRGCLLGLAVGDAVGTTVEFSAPGSFAPVTDMTGGGPFSLPAGAWTDDTSMALCLAESLIVKRGFDPIDQLERYVRWWKQGYLSSTGKCFDIGRATRLALQRFRQTGEPFPGDADTEAAGNGPLMKLAPVPMAYALQPILAEQYAVESARTTHGAPQAHDAARFFARLLVEALTGRGDIRAGRTTDGLHPEVAAVAAGSYLHKSPPEIRGNGYVVLALEAALWAVATTFSYEEAVLAAVNLGDDADTTAAIAGQLAGAFYGVDAIPLKWRERLVLHDEIERFADQLFALAIPVDADWAVVNAFAHTIDGYMHFGDAWGERLAAAHGGELPEDVDDLHALLFLQFRADRHAGVSEITGDDAEFRREILRRMRASSA